LLGLATAMFTHAFHNTMAVFLSGWEGLFIGAAIDWTGWLFMLGIIIWATWREQLNLKKYLATEVQARTITPALFRTASSGKLQVFARVAAIFTGKFSKTTRFYQLCGEYAHKRRQYDRLGDEAGNMAIIQKLRAEMSHLAPFVQV
jgi:hypothetical protein